MHAELARFDWLLLVANSWYATNATCTLAELLSLFCVTITIIES